MARDKFIRVSKETHQQLSEIGKKGESYDDVINRLIEDSLTWSRFKEKFIMEFVEWAEIEPDRTTTYEDITEYFKVFFGEQRLEKMKKERLRGFPKAANEKREG